MKRPLGFSSCVVLLLASTAACQGEGMQDDGAPDQPDRFETQEAAAQKAIADFREVLASGVDIETGIDAATLERSQPGPSVPRVDLDFTRLLEADTATSMNELVASERNVVVPLLADGGVATIVEVARDEGGWRVVGLAGQDIAADLSAVFESAGATASVTLYEVPNLQARVYGVAAEGGERLHTDYGEQFDIRQGVEPATLLPVLRADAQEFQRVYGDSLRTGRLLR